MTAWESKSAQSLAGGQGATRQTHGTSHFDAMLLGALAHPAGRDTLIDSGAPLEVVFESEQAVAIGQVVLGLAPVDGHAFPCFFGTAVGAVETAIGYLEEFDRDPDWAHWLVRAALARAGSRCLAPTLRWAADVADRGRWSADVIIDELAWVARLAGLIGDLRRTQGEDHAT